MVDYAMMSRNVTRLHEPVPLRQAGRLPGARLLRRRRDRHGALLGPAGDRQDAKIGYPPARVWGSPTTALWAHRVGAQRAKRLLFTGDSLSGREALEWGLAIEAPAPEQLAERTEILLERIARVPVNQLMMMKLLVNQTLYAQGLHATQVLGTVFDGITRHTAEGYAFQQRAAEAGLPRGRARARRALRRPGPLQLQGLSAAAARRASRRWTRSAAAAGRMPAARGCSSAG